MAEERLWKQKEKPLSGSVCVCKGISLVLSLVSACDGRKRLIAILWDFNFTFRLEKSKAISLVIHLFRKYALSIVSQ